MSSYFLKIFCVLLLLLLHISGFTLGLNWPSKVAEMKCIEKERQALLNFKESLIDDYGMLSTWRVDENNRDCCKWKGIKCNNETGHVQMLDLHGQYDKYLIGPINITLLIDLQNMEYLDLSTNDFIYIHIPKLIGSFTKLRYLNLSFSELNGKIPFELGNLSKLEYLNLNQNHLFGEIPSQLGKLTRLRYLDISDNDDIDGEIPYQLGNLSQLRYLDLRGNLLFGAIPFQIGNLPMLHTLRLGGNFEVKTNGAEWLSSLYSLTNLELRSLHNLGSSHHWLQTISKIIPNLQELRLVDCNLVDNGTQLLFDSHSNFSTSLTILDLSNNMLTTSAFRLLFNFSLKLRELYLSHNNFVLSSPLYPNFPSLVILDLSYNNMTPSIFQGNFIFGSKLETLILQNCSLMDGSFLESSASIANSSSSLIFLDLSHNLLKSQTIFHWLFNFITNIRTLYLSGNLLEGPIPDGLGKVMNSLQVLDLSSNKLRGEVPAFFGNMCTLQELYLGKNNLSGEISSFIQNSSWCNRDIFSNLDLSYNQITGMLPKSIGLLSELNILYLQGNSLEGDITELHLTNLSNLEFLNLSYNSLSVKFVSSWVPPFQLFELGLASCKLGSTFPSWLKTQSSLQLLDISDAGLNDTVPEWLWNNLLYMQSMNMSHNNLVGAISNKPFKIYYGPSLFLNSNQFEGGVPSFLQQASKLMLFNNKFSDLFSFLCDTRIDVYLGSLDLSNNHIKGQLPDCWKSLNSLLFLDLSNNKLTGKIPLSMGTLVKLEALVLRNNSLVGELPSTLKNCSNLMLLDVGENLLSGLIPSWIGEMQQLIILSMKGNHFSGELPIHLCYLRNIQLLDLSRNNLSKGIPSCLRNFTALFEKGINSSEIQARIYWYNSTYVQNYGYMSMSGYTLNIMLMWKGVEYGFKDPEVRLKSIDISSNNLTGGIPKEIGYLLGLVSLNLSRNNLSGEIPSEIGNLSSLEFVDLSRNHFSGKIPSSLSKIDRLAVLDLSNNSLSGRIPDGRQLQTFDASSFEGNPDLCGTQLNKSCPEDKTPIQPHESARDETDDNSAFYKALYMSMGLGYFTGFWCFMGPILFWRPWRVAYLRFLNRLIDYVYVMVAVNVAKCHRWLKRLSSTQEHLIAQTWRLLFPLQCCLMKTAIEKVSFAIVFVDSLPIILAVMTKYLSKGKFERLRSKPEY
ncbi:Receptor-like protein 12, partial [Mucuna pruriens]